MIFVTEMIHNLYGNLTFICGSIEEENGELKYRDLRQILTSPDYCSKMRLDKTFHLLFKRVSNFVLPTVLPADLDSDDFDAIILSGDNALDILENTDSYMNVYNLVKSLYDGDVLNDEKFVTMLKNSYEGLEQLTNNTFKYKLPVDIDANTKKIVLEYNANSNGEFIDYNEVKTMTFSVMNSPEDRIYLVLPKPYYSKNHQELNEVLDQQEQRLMKQYNVFNPYPTAKKRIIVSNYKSFSDIDIRNIVGQDINNHLPLQDNEVDFYNAMCNYIDKFLDIYCATENLSKEATIDKCVCKNTPVEKIFERLIRILVNKNWSHSPEVPINEFTDTNEQGDTDSETSDAPSNAEGDRLIFALENKLEAGKSGHADYYQVIYDFIQSNKCSIYALPEVIIKLARWGNRKPTRLTLCFPKSNSLNKTELDLFTMTTDYTETSIEVETIDSKNYVLSGFVTSGDIPIVFKSDANLFSHFKAESFDAIAPDTILGVQVMQSIKIDGRQTDRLIVMDLLTFITKLEEISGVILTEDNGLEFDINIDLIKEHKLYLNDVENYINSKNKAIMKYLNCNEIYLGIDDYNKDELNQMSLFRYISLIANQASLNWLLVNNKFMKGYRAVSPLFLRYLSDALVISKYEDKAEAIKESLNSFKMHYDETINAIKAYKETHNEKTEQKDKTELFNQSSVKELAQILFRIDNSRTFYTAETNLAKDNNCLTELKYLQGDLKDLDITHLTTTKIGLEALFYLTTLYLDDNHINKTLVSQETKNKILDIIKALYKTDNIPVVRNAIYKKLKK